MMQTIFWGDTGVISEINRAFSACKAVVATSDTVLGLLAPCTKAGFQVLNNIKCRYKKPYLVITGESEGVFVWSTIAADSHLFRFLASCWPGPLTVILLAKKGLPSFMKGPGGTIAVRVPDHAGLRRLLVHHSGLFSTSANQTGKPVPKNPGELDQDIIDAVPYIIQGDEMDTRSDVLPSTIIDCTGAVPRVVRVGAYSVAQLEQQYGGPFS